jgi:ribosomal protein L15E
VKERGLVLVNGYAMNEDGYEPYKDIYLVDVRNPAEPTIVGTLPRPTPPAVSLP